MSALVTYVALGISASVVEQNFSKGSLLFSNRRLSSSASTEEACLKVCLDLPQHDRTSIWELARRVWNACYRAPRKHVKFKLSKGVKRKVTGEMEVPNEINYRQLPEVDVAKRRRAAAREAAAAEQVDLSLPSAMAPTELPDSWGETHSKELAFQASKLHARKVEAAASKLLGEDTTSELQAAAQRQSLQSCGERFANSHSHDHFTASPCICGGRL